MLTAPRGIKPTVVFLSCDTSTLSYAPEHIPGALRRLMDQAGAKLALTREPLETLALPDFLTTPAVPVLRVESGKAFNDFAKRQLTKGDEVWLAGSDTDDDLVALVLLGLRLGLMLKVVRDGTWSVNGPSGQRAGMDFLLHVLGHENFISVNELPSGSLLQIVADQHP